MQTRARHGAHRSGYQSRPSRSAKLSPSSNERLRQPHHREVCRHSTRCLIHASQIGQANRDSTAWFVECCDRRWNNSVRDKRPKPADSNNLNNIHGPAHEVLQTPRRRVIALRISSFSDGFSMWLVTRTSTGDFSGLSRSRVAHESPVVLCSKSMNDYDGPI